MNTANNQKMNTQMTWDQLGNQLRMAMGMAEDGAVQLRESQSPAPGAGTVATPNAAQAPSRAVSVPPYPTPLPDYPTQTPSYAAPVPSHAMPISSYAAPVPLYPAPIPDYPPQIPSYGAPVPSYAMQAPSYAPAYVAEKPQQNDNGRPEENRQQSSCLRKVAIGLGCIGPATVIASAGSFLGAQSLSRQWVEHFLEGDWTDNQLIAEYLRIDQILNVAFGLYGIGAIILFASAISGSVSQRVKDQYGASASVRKRHTGDWVMGIGALVSASGLGLLGISTMFANTEDVAFNTIIQSAAATVGIVGAIVFLAGAGQSCASCRQR